MNFSPTLYHGESRIFPVSLADPDTGLFVDLTSGKWQVSTVEWQLKTAIEAPDPPLLAHSLVDGGVTLAGGAVAQQIKLLVAPADTPPLAPGGYFHDLVAVFASGFRLYLWKPSGIQVVGVVNQL